MVGGDLGRRMTKNKEPPVSWHRSGGLFSLLQNSSWTLVLDDNDADGDGIGTGFPVPMESDSDPYPCARFLPPQFDPGLVVQAYRRHAIFVGRIAIANLDFATPTVRGFFVGDIDAFRPRMGKRDGIRNNLGQQDLLAAALRGGQEERNSSNRSHEPVAGSGHGEAGSNHPRKP